MRFLPLFQIALLCGCNADKIAQLDKENKELRANLTTIELQEKCSRQALSEFKDIGYDGPEYKTAEKSANLANHYNADLNKCFMEVDTSDFTKSTIDDNYSDITISDAYERKEYAAFALISYDVVDCYVLKSSGEKQRCKSVDEFKELIRQFMEK